MKEKKNLQFGLRLERGIAEPIQKLSEQSKLPVSEIIRLCVGRQLAEDDNFGDDARERKTLQVSVRFEDSLAKQLGDISRRTDLSVAEIVRLCLAKQITKIRRQGLKLKFELNDK